MPRRRQKKTKTIAHPNRVDKLKHYFILTIRDTEGVILDIVNNTDYDILLLEGMERSKDSKGSWEVYNSLGKRLDGSYDRRKE